MQKRLQTAFVYLGNWETQSKTTEQAGLKNKEIKVIFGYALYLSANNVRKISIK